MNIIEIIQNHYDSFTNKQKTVANYLIENHSDVCYISLATLSEKIGCSEVTVLKFCKKIGIENFIELKEEFRNYNQLLVNKYSVSTYSVPTEIVDNSSKLNYIKDICNEELNKTTDFYNSVDLENVQAIANLMASKNILYLFAHDASRSLASFLKLRLDILNINVVFVDLSNMTEVEYVTKQVTNNDLAFIFSFPNYYYSTRSVAQRLKENNCDIVLMTDSLECPTASCTDNVLICNTQTKIFYNSWLLPVALINILTSVLAMIIENKNEI